MSKRREAGSQPLVRGKVLNHAATTDVGQQGPTWRYRDYNAFSPAAPKTIQDDTGRRAGSAISLRR